MSGSVRTLRLLLVGSVLAVLAVSLGCGSNESGALHPIPAGQSVRLDGGYSLVVPQGYEAVLLGRGDVAMLDTHSLQEVSLSRVSTRAAAADVADYIVVRVGLDDSVVYWDYIDSRARSAVEASLPAAALESCDMPGSWTATTTARYEWSRGRPVLEVFGHMTKQGLPPLRVEAFYRSDQRVPPETPEPYGLWVSVLEHLTLRWP